jgi:hypothetical protein
MHRSMLLCLVEQHKMIVEIINLKQFFTDALCIIDNINNTLASCSYKDIVGLSSSSLDSRSSVYKRWEEQISKITRLITVFSILLHLHFLTC